MKTQPAEKQAAKTQSAKKQPAKKQAAKKQSAEKQPVNEQLTESQSVQSQAADVLKAFDRFYTRRIGLPATGLPDTRFSATERRLLSELSQRPGLTAGALARELALDAGYLSRLLATLRVQGLVRAQRAAGDARQQLLSLTAAGRRAFAPLAQRSRVQAQAQAQALLAPLSTRQQQELSYAATRVQQLLGSEAPAAPQLRCLQAGELGWVVARHGALYAQEHGWDQRFEALVARIVADYVEQHDAAREAAWIAQWQGTAMGCVFVVQARDQRTQQPLPRVAQLRLLLVEPAARGRGIGKLLCAACEGFARQAGYTHMRLWTSSVLLSARAIYVAAGYRLVGSQRHHRFGHALLDEVWEKAL